MITIERVLALIDKMIDDERRWFMEACEQGEEPSASGAVVVMKLELLKQQVKDLIKEPASEDVEKEIDRYFNTEGIPVTGGALRDTARHFAQWQREQMMKGAVNGWVARDKDCDIAIFREAPTKDAEIGMWMPCKNAFIFPDKDEYPDVTWDSEPQKVKVIIVKE